MKSAETLIKEHLNDARLMQLATIKNGKPWVCTVYFVFDDRLNFYWLSLPSSRHSEEAKADPNTAVAIAVKQSQPVIGVQAQGKAKVVTESKTVAMVMAMYVEKYGNGKDFLNNFKDGVNKHSMYIFTPIELVLVDEVNFSNNPRQNIEL